MFFITLILIRHFFLPAVNSATYRQLKYQTQSFAVSVLGDPSADSIAQNITMRKGTAERQLGEADTIFLKRVLPFSYPASKDLVAYAWRPSAFGKQLFFSVRGSGDNEGGRDMFILDPIQVDIYAVQVLKLPTMGNLTDLAALFFVDVDQNGQKEMLTLLEDNFNEQWKNDNGELVFVHRNHHQTLVFQYVGLNSAGRPRYQEDQTQRSYLKEQQNYLNELPTAATVRKAIVQHQLLQRKSSLKAAAKLSK